jgi:hypothetical protein
MNRQQLFNTVLDHLRAQGRRSIGADGQCRYRGNAGCKCAIGILIPDDRYSPELEGRGAFCIAVRDAAGLNCPASSLDFLMQLQQLHDKLPDYGFMPALESAAVQFAYRWELNFKPSKWRWLHASE